MKKVVKIIFILIFVCSCMIMLEVKADCDSNIDHNGVSCNITTKSPGEGISNNGLVTYIKKDTDDNLLFCVEHAKNAPSGGTVCTLKYDNYNKTVLAALAAVMQKSGSIDLNTYDGKQEYLKIQLALNDILYYDPKVYTDIYGPYSDKNDYWKAGMDASTRYNGTLSFNLNGPSQVMDFDTNFNLEITDAIISKSFAHEYTHSFNIVNYSVEKLIINGEVIGQSEYAVEKINSNNGRIIIINSKKLVPGDNTIEVVIKYENSFKYASLYSCSGQDVVKQIYTNDNVTKKLTATRSINIKVPDCKERFNSLIKNGEVSIQDRYSLYKEFEGYGRKYENLLNMTKKNGIDACTAGTTKASTGGCLNYEYNRAANDFSYYTEYGVSPTDDTKLEYICNTSFSFKNNLGIKEGNNTPMTHFEIFSGRKIPYSDGIIAKGKIVKNCWFKNDQTFNFKNLDYFDSIKFNGFELINSNLNKEQSINVKSGFSSITFDYDFTTNNIYLQKGTGEIINKDYEIDGIKKDETDNSYYIITKNGKRIKIFKNFGNAVYTRYLQNKANGIIPFEINFTESGKKTFEEQSFSFNDNESCTYSATEELFDCGSGKCDLNLEFREIDTSNSFMNHNGDQRNTMTNWCYDVNRITNLNSILDVTEVQKYLEGATSAGKELYKDGNIDDFDITAAQYYLADHKLSSCSNNNLLVNYFIKGKTNSYNKKYKLNILLEPTDIIDGDGPKYKIRLDSNLIKKINEYAEDNNIDYSTFNLSCTDKSLCTSKLLTYLKNSGDLIINYSTKR